MLKFIIIALLLSGCAATSPLHIAVHEKDYNEVERLIDSGVDVNDTNGAYFIHNELTPLHEAARVNDYKMVSLLIGRGADLNARSEIDYTPLHFATLGNSVEAVKVLLDNGANPRLRHIDGKNALDIAVFQGHLDAATIIEEFMFGKYEVK